jgi:alpha-glucosidase
MWRDNLHCVEGEDMESIRDTLRSIRFIGIANAFQTFLYAVQRDRSDRRLRRMKTPSRRIQPGELKNYDSIDSGLRFNFTHAELEVKFLAPDLVRITWGPGRLPPPYALVKTDWPFVDTEHRNRGVSHGIGSSQFEVLVSEDGALKYLDVDGNLLREERVPSRQGDSWSVQVDLAPDEHVYGLGDRSAPLNLRSGSYRMWNTDPGGSLGPGDDPLYLSIPTLVNLHSQGCTLVFYENSFNGTVKVEDHMVIAFGGGALRYYFMVGAPTQLLERYTELTGRPVLPPRWAFGYHQSRWGYKSEQIVREIVAGFKAHALPLSVVHLDIDYMDGYRVFTVDSERFPDLAGLAQELGNQGIRIVTILDPGVKRDTQFDVYSEGLTEDVFCKRSDGKTTYGLVWPGWCAFPDFTRPETRFWWGSYYKRLLDKGVAGFWHDMNEPASFAAWGDYTLPLNTRHDLDGSEGDHRQAHNLYGLLMNRSGYEALRKFRPDRRPWIVSRSGWAGVQRYAWHWTGDTESTWQSLRMTISMILNLGLSGVPFVGPDIGGFSGSPTAELYLRWFQLATFLPFFRTHSAVHTPHREPWTFGEPYLTIIREFLAFRYKILPYLYTLAWHANQYGHPLVRPLFWSDVEDPDLWAIDDAFLLGENLLVAPILEEGVNSRGLVLPKGDWYNFWDDTILRGPGEVELDASLEHIPLLVTAGCVLPMDKDDVLELHIYPPVEGPGRSLLYSDEGDGYGESRLDLFELTRKGDKVDMRWVKEGKYPFPYSAIDIHMHGLHVTNVHVDEHEVPYKDNRIRVQSFNRIRFQVSS